MVLVVARSREVHQAVEDAALAQHRLVVTRAGDLGGARAHHLRAHLVVLHQAAAHLLQLADALGRHLVACRHITDFVAASSV